MPFHRGWRPSQSMRRPEKKKTLKRIRILEIEDSKVVSDQLKPPLGGDQEGRQENVRIISHFIFWCRCTWRSTLCPRLYRWDKPPHRGDNDKKRTIMSWRPHKVQVEKSTLLGSTLFCGQNLSQISGGEDHVRRSNDELAATRQRPVLPPAGFKGHRLASSQKWKWVEEEESLLWVEFD